MKRLIGSWVAVAAFVVAVGTPAAGQARTWDFSYTGDVQTWVVPPGVTSADFDVYGASGGDAGGDSFTGYGGAGGRARATLTLVPGTVLEIRVGGAGASPGTVPPAGYNGGGRSLDGYSGGGATDIRPGGGGFAERRLVAGGGGGMGGFGTGRRSGHGGGLSGTDGQGSFIGFGGTQDAGGASSSAGGEGGFGRGGPTNNFGYYYYGGGGGGWYGGGAGSSHGGGGGGSGFGPEGTIFETGVHRGHGSASITVPERRLTVDTQTTFPGPSYGLGYVQAAGGIDCGYGDRTNCLADYLEGTPVTLTATPATGASFAYWSGACTGTSPTCVASVSSNVTATAHFEITRHPLTVAKPGNGSGVVSSTPIMGFTTIDCGTTCTSGYLDTATVSLAAAPATGSDFAGWSGDCSGTATTCTVAMATATGTVNAVFTLQKRVLTASRTGTGAGTISSDVGGLSCGATCAVELDYGTEVTLQATSATGSEFLGWGPGPCSTQGTTPTCVVTMSQARSQEATFGLLQFPLDVTRAGSGTGTVTANVGDIACGAECSDEYDYGTAVTLTASAGPNAHFSGWTGACAGASSTCTVAVTEARAVTARFDLDLRSLTAATDGTGAGSVTSDVGGIDCGSACTASVEHGTSVTLTATPATSSTFTGWAGACTGTGPCMVTMDQARSVSATFTLKAYALEVGLLGTGSGRVTSSPVGIDCGTTCTTTLDHGTTVTLTAAAEGDSDFTGWTGACTGTGPCVVTVSEARNVSATFTLKTYDLEVSLLGTGSGRVTSSPAGIDCGTTCTTTQDHGTTVTLIAVADANSTFTGWSGACNGTGPCVVTIDQARAVEASFTRTVVPPVDDPPVDDPPGGDPPGGDPPEGDPFVPPVRVPTPADPFVPPAPTPAAADKTAPRFTLRAVRTRAGVVRRTGRLTVRLTSSERASFRLQPVGSRSTKVSVTTKPRVIGIKLTGTLRKRIQWSKARTVRVKVRVIGTDPSGNAVRRTITLRIRR